MKACDVLVVGAGPTGLVLALWLTRLGAKVQIIDKTAEPGTTSRALAIQARTLELYRQLDLADAVVARAREVPAVNLWARGERKARVDFEQVGVGLTPYPYLRIFPQDEHERLLVERLEAMGVSVERKTGLVGYRDEGGQVVAELRHADEGAETIEAAYIAGCDGARSRVREVMGVGFPGGTYSELFYVADVVASGPPIDGELHVDLDEADFLAIFPLAGERRARLVGTVRGERARLGDQLRFDDVSDRAIKNLKVTVDKTNWFSTYHVHHRVAQRFRAGRAFLLGDAAHIHSPAGGQGMNTGIGDAINLAWKLKAALDGAPDALLDIYETERIAFARRLVKTTDQAFTVATADGEFANLIRVWIAPAALQAALWFEVGQRIRVPHCVADQRELSRKPAEPRQGWACSCRRPHALGGRRRNRQLRRSREDGLAGAGLRRRACRACRRVRGKEVAAADFSVDAGIRARRIGSERSLPAAAGHLRRTGGRNWLG